MKKESVLLIFNILVVVSIVGIICTLTYISSNLSFGVSGKVIDIEKESILEGSTNGRSITISSPEERIYDFERSYDLAIDLNVSADFIVDNWRFTLIDSEHSGKIVRDRVPFDPGITFNPLRWSNKLIVHAYDSSGREMNKSVSFYVSVPNSAPVIEFPTSEIYVCEGSYLEHYFNVTDIDENKNPGALESFIDPIVYPSETFYTEPASYWLSNGSNSSQFKITSGKMRKEDVGGIYGGFWTYEKNLFVVDGQYADLKKINITAIEVNNAPSIEEIGVQTILTEGENSVFYKQVRARDVENGNENSGNLEFSIKILDSTGQEVNLFEIDSIGIMNFNANESSLGSYRVEVCVKDKGIEDPYEKIQEFCGQTGESIVECEDFSLNIIKENRGPTIIDYSPSLSLNISETEGLKFNVSAYDPDKTPLDIYWYVNNVLKKYSSRVWGEGGFDEFTYSSGCIITKGSKIKVEVTDGLLNDSIEWNLDVNASCVDRAEVSGELCSEKWLCAPWGICQNIDTSLMAGILPREDYSIIKENCLGRGWSEANCGFQIRSCFDMNSCNTSYSKPAKILGCFYMDRPDCDDGIKNCHQGGCELLLDCGGPCPACATCSDGIMNQNEEDVDCGGPCPWACVTEEVSTKRPRRWAYIIVMAIFLVVVITQIIKLIKISREFKQEIV